MTRPKTAPSWWVCARGHVFSWGAESWERTALPGWCFVTDRHGEPCLDSSHLWGPFESSEQAQAQKPALLAQLARLNKTK